MPDIPLRSACPSRPQLLSAAAALILLHILPGTVQAANRTWDGSDGTDFETPANWNTLPADNLTSDIAVFSGTVTAAQPRLSSSRSLNGLAFGTSSGGWALDSASSANTLSLGGGGISTSGQTAGMNTVGSNLGIGAAQTWRAGTGGTLLVTGSVTGTGGLPLTINSTGNLGNIILSPAAGNSVNLTGSNNSGFFLLARSGGRLELGGDGVSAPPTASTNTILNNSTGSTFGSITITGAGAVRTNSGTWNFGDLARNSSTDYFSGSLEVRGGTVSLNGARYLSAGTIAVSGGTLKITNTGSVYSNGGRFSLGAVGTGGTATMTISGGSVDLAQANLGNSIGTAISTIATQTGGTVTNGVTPGGGANGGTTNTFTIGHSGMTTTGSGSTLTYSPISNVLAGYTLAGGTLLSAGAIQGTTPASSGTNGSAGSPPGAVINPGTGNVRNFNFNGGTLAVGAFNATHLGRSSATGTPEGPPHADPTANSVGIGTLHNHGGTLAPGGDGTAGKTLVTGGYSAHSGTLAVDIGGTVQATAFQSGNHDFLSVSGTATLGGNLAVTLIGGHVPQNSDVHTIVTAGTLEGAFSNTASGQRVATSNGTGSYLVSTTGNSVILSQYESLTAPIITVQPAPQSVAVGDSVTFTAAASSSVQPAWQWRRNGIPIDGATGSSHTIPSASFAHAGTYDVIVSNPSGSAASSTATLTVNLFAPEVMGQRPIAYDFTSVRELSQAPMPGVHPRVYFNAGDLPSIRDRLANTEVGREAFKMVQIYTDLMRRGSSLAYHSQPAAFKTMPDGTARVSNPGLYDRSLTYNDLAAGSTTQLEAMVLGVSGDTLAYALAGEMSLEAFECLVNVGQPGIETRAANLATALDTWATWVLTQTDYPGLPGATYGSRYSKQFKFGGHLNALTYDMAYNSMTQTQRDNVRKVLARLMGAYRASDSSDTDYTGVGCAPEAVATNWVAINSFKLLVACAIEGEVTAAEGAGYTAADLSAWFRRAMGSYHKFLTYGWFRTGAPLEGLGKNYLFGGHMIAFARRGYDFFGHPHLRAYTERWMPALAQPYGHSFIAYDLLGGTGSDNEKGRYFLNSQDHIALKWMYPDNNAADFSFRNFIRTEYKDAGGAWQSFIDLRDTKFTLRSVYQNQLLPAAIFASDIASTASWEQHNAAARPDLDRIDAEGGTVVSRSGHDTDATSLLFHVRQDFGGHTFADRNTFTLSSLGRIFINYNSGSSNSGLQAAACQSIVEVDGLSMALTPKEGVKMRIPAKLAAWTPPNGSAMFATGDATYAYSNEWTWNPYATGSPAITSGFIVDQNSHNTFRRAENKIAEPFGDTPFVSFPHWVNPGQFEGIQSKPYNPMRQVHRTIGLIRGAKPYALVIDDVRKDDASHTYKWLASIAEDLAIVTGSSLPAGCDPLTDVVLEEPPSTGDRRLLVRILRAGGTPVPGTGPSVEGSSLAYTEILENAATNEEWKRLVIERAGTTAPDFRILLFPFRAGDPLPGTTFAANQLDVSIGTQADTFSFAPRTAVIGGQSVTMNEFTLSRNGSTLLDYRNQIEPTAARGPSGAADPVPAAPASLNATAVSGPVVQLSWTDQATGETAYVIERSVAGIETWLPLASALPADTTAYADHSVQPEAIYDYRVRCVGNTGLSAFASIRGISSDPVDPDTTPPSPPSGLAATLLSETQVRLDWTDNAVDENHYIVERSPAGSGIWALLAGGLPPDTTTFTDATAGPAEVYDYRVRCGGDSGFSGFATTTVPVPSGIGDGIPGSWRLQYFGNGLTIIPGVSGPDDDPDGDGSSNRMEQAAGTVPTDPSSVFKVHLFEPVAGGFRIGFPAVPGKVYQVEHSSDPATGIWTVEAAGLTTTGTSIETTVTPDPQEKRGFYRARAGN